VNSNSTGIPFPAAPGLQNIIEGITRHPHKGNARNTGAWTAILVEGSQPVTVRKDAMERRNDPYYRQINRAIALKPGRATYRRQP
jgi:hypothetical protein